MTKPLEELSVLIVHNSRYMRIIVSDTLKVFGFKSVIEAPNNAAAVDTLKLNKIDLLVAQYEETLPPERQLPAMVHKAESTLKSQPKIVLISLSAEKDLIEQAHGLGADVVLAVPIVAKALFASISALFNTEQSQVRSTHYAGPDRRNRENRSTHQREKRQAAIKESLRHKG